MNLVLVYFIGDCIVPQQDSYFNVIGEGIKDANVLGAELQAGRTLQQ